MTRTASTESEVAGPLESGPPVGTVLHVLNGLPFGGNETLCIQLMEHLDATERLLLNIGPDGGMRAKFEALGAVKIFSIPYERRSRLRFVWKVAALLREVRPDAIIVYPFGLHVLVALAARLVGIETVLVHAGNPPPADLSRRRMWRAIVWASRLLGTPIVACSRYVHVEFQRLSRWLPGRSCTVHNGIDTGQIAHRAERARCQREERAPVVGMVGRLTVIKDQETLVRAMARVSRMVPGVRLWIIGEGETRDRLERVAAELKLEEVVRFWGARRDAPELLGQMDVYVFSTTRDEGFGIAIVEAMAAGLPIVASDVAACREVLLDGNAGILVPPRSPDAMAAAIEHLLLAPDARGTWSARAREGAGMFSAERCAGKWASVLTGSTP